MRSLNAGRATSKRPKEDDKDQHRRVGDERQASEQLGKLSK